MKKVKAVIRFEDEAPRIGSGVRRVFIERGRRWGYITECATGFRVRMALAKLEALRPQEVRP